MTIGSMFPVRQFHAGELFRIVSAYILIMCNVTLCSFKTDDNKNNYVAETDSLTGLTVYENVEQQPTYTGYYDYKNHWDISQSHFFWQVAISMEDDSIPIEEMFPAIDITFIIDVNGDVVGERFTKKSEKELNSFQKEFLRQMSKQEKWIPGKINGQNVNTKIRGVVRISPQR